MSTYYTLNLIHRYSGLSLLAFLMMYFVSGFIMNHHKWFEGPKSEPVEIRQNFHSPSGISPDELAVYIQDSFELRGYIEAFSPREDGTMKFEFYHPGTFQAATYHPEDEILEIQIRHQNFYQTMNAFHRIHKYGGGKVYNIYVFIMDLTSLSLLLFAASGVYLWLKVIRRKLLGWTILMASILYAAIVVGRFMI